MNQDLNSCFNTHSTNVDVLITKIQYGHSADAKLFIAWLELAKYHVLMLTSSKQTGNDSKAKQLMQAAFTGFSQHPLMAAEPLKSYLPYMLRFFFAAGNYDAKLVKAAQKLYQQLNQDDFYQQLDCHYCWQWFNGSTRGLERVKLKAQQAFNDNQLTAKQRTLYLTLEALIAGDSSDLDNFESVECNEPRWDDLPLLRLQFQSLAILL